MLSILSDTQKAVLDTITMKLNLGHALDYLKNAGCEMSERTYYRHKKKIQELKLERMRFIAKVAYEEQHLERIDRMELIENQMWLSYWREKDHTKKVKILSEIASIQPYISSYYDATRALVEDKEAKLRVLEKTPYSVTVDSDSELYWSNSEYNGPPGLDSEPLDSPERMLCSICRRWFKNDDMLKVHNCSRIFADASNDSYRITRQKDKKMPDSEQV